MGSHPPSHRGVTLGSAVRVTAGDAAGRQGYVREAQVEQGRVVAWRLKTADEDPGADRETWAPVDAVVLARAGALPPAAPKRALAAAG